VTRFVKLLAVGLALVVGVVAALFGALIAGAILVAAALLALLGGKRFKANLSAGPVRGAGSSGGAPVAPGGDVIDVEVRKVEPPPRELT